MSVTRSQLPTKAVHVAVAAACIDVLPVDKKGFVILDACVSLKLAAKFAQLVLDFGDRAIDPVPDGVKAYPPEFTMVQYGLGGPVAIQARTPLAVATDFCKLAA
jgi:hypothetical protein